MTETGAPPVTTVSLQNRFFIACCGVTQGPPDSLLPGASWVMLPFIQRHRARGLAAAGGLAN